MLYTRWTLAGISIGFLARPNGSFFFAPPPVVVTSFSLLFSDVLLDLPFLPPPKLSERRALDFAGEDSFLAVFFLSNANVDAAGVTIFALSILAAVDEGLRRGGVRGALRLGSSSPSCSSVVCCVLDGDFDRLVGVVFFAGDDIAATGLLPRPLLREGDDDMMD